MLSTGGRGDKLEMDGDQLPCREHGEETNSPLKMLSSVYLPLFQTVLAKPSLPQYLSCALVFAQPAVLCGRKQC